MHIVFGNTKTVGFNTILSCELTEFLVGIVDIMCDTMLELEMFCFLFVVVVFGLFVCFVFVFEGRPNWLLVFDTLFLTVTLKLLLLFKLAG